MILIGVAINLHQARLANSRLQELAHKSVQFQVSERRRFARELHDGINQMMVSVLFRIEAAAAKVKRSDPAAEEDLEKGLSILKDTISEVRQISHDLRPSLLDDMGLKVALNSLLVEFSERTEIETNLDYELSTKRLPEDIEITFYRVVQEALTNVERHSNANQVRVHARQAEGMTWLSIADNGQGFDMDKQQGPGIGVCNIRERVELLSGICLIHSAPGKGTVIEAGLQPIFFSKVGETTNGRC